MGLWHGRLCNSTLDVCIDSALLIFLVYAYSLQLSAYRYGKTSGLSKYYVLFSVLVQNAQLSQAVLTAAYAWPDDRSPVIAKLNDGTLSGLAAFGAVLGLLQIFLQWSCAICVLLVHIWSTCPGNSLSILVIAFLHAASTVHPAANIALPKPAMPDWVTGIYMGLITMANVIVAPCFLVLAIFAQWQGSRSRSADSPTTSMFLWQAIAFTFVGLRLFWRQGPWTPTGMDPIPPNLDLTEWVRICLEYVAYSYAWAFQAGNVAIQAIGCAFLALCYWKQPVNIADDEAFQPLLKV